MAGTRTLPIPKRNVAAIIALWAGVVAVIAWAFRP